LNLLVKIDSKENMALSGAAICEHIIKDGMIHEDKTIIPFKGDGLYKVIHIILPTYEWFLEQEDLSEYTNIYVYKDEKIYKVINDELEELSSLDELMELNFTEQVLAYKDEVFVFNMCGIKKCFYNIVRTILNNLCTDKCSKQDTLYRDLVWMAINCIQYCIDLGNFYEAQRILEKVTTCNGICHEVNIMNVENTSCGCRK